MNRKSIGVGLAALAVLVLAGCLTPAELRAKRIDERKAAFAAFPAATQERIRGGHLQTGDSTNAAWFVYGSPSRVYRRLTPGGTNEVWSYLTTEVEPFDSVDPAWFPYVGRRGQLYYEPGYAMTHGYYYDKSEYLRIEFRTNAVHTIDFTDPSHEY